MELDKIRPGDLVQIKGENGEIFLAQVLQNHGDVLFIEPIDTQFEEGYVGSDMIERHWILQGRKRGRPSMKGEALEEIDVPQVKPRAKMKNPFLDKMARA
jgi:hypothetical protein